MIPVLLHSAPTTGRFTTCNMIINISCRGNRKWKRSKNRIAHHHYHFINKNCYHSNHGLALLFTKSQTFNTFVPALLNQPLTWIIELQ